jgi:hypothetical protein
MILRKRTINKNLYVTENKLKKYVYVHTKGYIETFYKDSLGNKQGLYTLVSRSTKMIMYESFYVDNKKIGIENFYDDHGKLTYSKIA